jgi:hypothetical protein
MCSQLLLQVRVHLGDGLDWSEILRDVPPDTAWLSQPQWQERLNLTQKERETAFHSALQAGVAEQSGQEPGWLPEKALTSLHSPQPLPPTFSAPHTTKEIKEQAADALP